MLEFRKIVNDLYETKFLDLKHKTEGNDGANLSKIANLNTLNVILNRINLSATVVGFVIVNDKLNKISNKIDIINKR